jgi:hypothetical protein
MFLQILRSFLGPFTVILDFFATRTELLTLLFCGYLCMFAAGSFQLSNIKKRTHMLIEEHCRAWLEIHSKATDHDLFAFFYPIWEAELKRMGAVFILNKFDLWPVPVTPNNVLVKIPLSPIYLRQYLTTGFVQQDKKRRF